MTCNFRLATAIYNHNVISFYVYESWVEGRKGLQNTEIIPIGA